MYNNNQSENVASHIYLLSVYQCGVLGAQNHYFFYSHFSFNTLSSIYNTYGVHIILGIGTRIYKTKAYCLPIFYVHKLYKCITYTDFALVDTFL